MRHILMAAAAISALASPAFAQDKGFYAGIEAGFLFAENNKLKVTAVEDGSVVFNENVVAIDHDSYGFDGDIIAGYDFGMFRLEGELGLKRIGHERYEASQVVCELTVCDEGEPEVTPVAVIPGSFEFDGDGKTRSWSLMLNGLIDFDISDAFRGYVGPGIGYHSTRITYDLGEPNAEVLPFRIKDEGLALQAIAGVAYALTDQLDLGLKYRYFRTSRLEDSYSEEGTDVTAATRFKSHSVLASLIYNFAAPMAPPPPPAPAPMPEPAPAPATQTCSDGSVILATDTCPVPPPPPPAPAPERG